jgi:hypothetical protein
MDARFHSIAATLGVALSEADILKATEIVRHLSEGVKARSERLSVNRRRILGVTQI